MSKSDQTLDAFLVLDYRTGNKEAMNHLVRRWHRKLCSRAYSYCKDYDQAKDIAQESWRIIISKLDRLKDPELFGSWVMAIVTRKSIDWLRKENRRRKRDEDYTGGQSLEESNSDNDQVIVLLKPAISTLKPKHQEVLRLYYTDGYPISILAKVLGCSEGTVKSRLHYAKQELKQKISRNHENNK